MKTSDRGVQLIQSFEGFRSKAYRDVVGVWTIGYGFTKGVKEGDTITKGQADDKMRRAVLPEFENEVFVACKVRPNQNQFDAMVSFAYNVGVGGFRRSSVLKAHNRGDHQAAGRAFGLWVKAGGKQWPGLVRRRSAEAALYLEPIPDDVSDPMDGPIEEMPQVVEPERSMMKSEINRASLAAGGTTALAAVAETARTVADVKYSVASLGDWLVPILLILIVALCGYIVWERVKQRRDGWA